MFLGFHGLAEDGLAAAILFFQGPGGFFEVVEHLGLDGRGMSDDPLGRGIDLEHRAATRASNVKGRLILRHAANDSAKGRLAGMELDWEDVENGEHFDAQEGYGNHGYGDCQYLPELKAAATRLKAPGHQAENVQGSEAKYQHPEDVVNVVLLPRERAG